MDMLHHPKGNRDIEFALATTRRESTPRSRRNASASTSAVATMAPGLEVDRDDYDDKALPFLAVLPDPALATVLLGSARLILGEPRAELLVEKAFEFDLPPAVAPIAPAPASIEVSRVAAEATHSVIGGLLTPLGLMHAICEVRWGLRAGVAVIKHRLLRALQGLGVALHEIEPAVIIYPKGAPPATTTTRIRWCPCTGCPTRSAPRSSGRSTRAVQSETHEPQSSDEALSQVLAALERASETAGATSLQHLLASLERLEGHHLGTPSFSRPPG